CCGKSPRATRPWAIPLPWKTSRCWQGSAMTKSDAAVAPGGCPDLDHGRFGFLEQSESITTSFSRAKPATARSTPKPSQSPRAGEGASVTDRARDVFAPSGRPVQLANLRCKSVFRDGTRLGGYAKQRTAVAQRCVAVIRTQRLLLTTPQPTQRF